jgi:FMN phosphatase YigB (HAD superfamily)
MIGDDPALDIVGGHNAGLRTIWLQTQSSISPIEEAAPNFTVTSVAQAVDLLLKST